MHSCFCVCIGNNLRDFPPDMYQFVHVERLNLSRNKICDNNVFIRYITCTLYCDVVFIYIYIYMCACVIVAAPC